MFAVMDIWNTIQTIVHSSDTVTLVIMAVVAIGAGFFMQEISGLLTSTVIALVAFALIKYIYAIVLQHADAGGLAQADWKAFETMQMLLVLGYAIIFGVVIAVVSTVRSLTIG